MSKKTNVLSTVVLGNSVTDTQGPMEQAMQKQDWNVMYLWDSRRWYLFTRTAMRCIHMINGMGAQIIQIHASEVYTLIKAVHGFAHITHGTYYCTASCIMAVCSLHGIWTCHLLLKLQLKYPYPQTLFRLLCRFPFQTVIYWLKK